RQPADVKLTRVPAPFGGYWLPYARAYFAAERLGVVGRTHQAMFDALHVNGTLPIQNVSIDELAAFYAGYGVKPEIFSATIRSAEIDAQIKRTEDFLTRSDTDSTPALIVAGRYKVIGAKSYDDLLRIADALVAMERARRRGGKAN
ncbi:MAG TPA: thiol:disulfide interchange protein DsbA/DsbL, partial [Pseudoxanthomonas sp.]|nr:thiol:disulfide interchange protein DsbA/DsbL [Pseudoxanthomonas sp.]